MHNLSWRQTGGLPIVAFPGVWVREIRQIEGLNEYRDDWHRLLGDCPFASFLMSPEWLEIYWRYFAGGQQLRILVVHSGEEVLGIVPLVVRKEQTPSGPMRILGFPLENWGSFYGPVGPDSTATLVAAFQYVAGQKRDWHLVELRWMVRATSELPCDSAVKEPSACVLPFGIMKEAGKEASEIQPHPCAQPEVDHHSGPSRTARALAWAGLPVREDPWQQVALVDLSGTWEEYWRERPGHLRKELPRLERRLTERGKLEYRRYRPCGENFGEADPQWDLYDMCVEVAQRSWQARSNTGRTLCHPSIARFQRDAHAAACRLGCADINLLLLDNRPIAFAYNYYWKGRLTGLRKGYDEAWARFSPGALLDRKMFEDSFRRGDRWYDLGAGYLEPKRPWATSIVTTVRYTHYPPWVFRAQFVRWRRWLARRIFSRETLLDRHAGER